MSDGFRIWINFFQVDSTKLDRSTNLGDYEPSFAMIDQDTKEKYWRFRSRNGKVSDRLTTSNVHFFNLKRVLGSLAICANMMITFSIVFAIAWGVSGTRPLGDYSATSSFIVLIYALPMGYLFLYRVLFLFFAILALPTKSIELQFVEAMQRQEAAAEDDRRAVMGDGTGRPPGKPAADTNGPRY